ncbi:MAG: hypothetical protein ACI8V2_004585 [Candidatus Latescibacterota bacterium]|jgi:hypothetical protein
MAEHHDAQEKGYESYALNIGPILIATAAILTVAILSFISMWVMFFAMERASIYLAEDPPPMIAQQKPFDGLLIQADPPAELAQVRLETRETLSAYGWVDKDALLVHLPIETAKALVLKRGFPVRK